MKKIFDTVVKAVMFVCSQLKKGFDAEDFIKAVGDCLAIDTIRNVKTRVGVYTNHILLSELREQISAYLLSPVSWVDTEKGRKPEKDASDTRILKVRAFFMDAIFPRYRTAMTMTEDAYLVDMYTHEQVLVDRKDRGFNIFLTACGVGPETVYARDIYHELVARAHNSVLRIRTVRHSTFVSGAVYVQLANGRYYKVTGTQWSEVRNGTDGVKLEDHQQNRTKTPFEVSATPRIDYAEAMLQGYNVDEKVASRKEYGFLLRVFLVALAFRNTMLGGFPFLGITGNNSSGKSSLAKLILGLLFGFIPDNIIVKSAPATDRDLAAGVKNSVVSTMDNVDKAPQLVNMADNLATLATRGAIELRTLYTTSQTETVMLDGMIVFTCVVLPWERQDLIQRMFTIPLLRMNEDKKMATSDVLEQMTGLHPGMSAAYLDDIESTVANLTRMDEMGYRVKTNSRMVEFVKIAIALAGGPEKAGMVIGLFNRLVTAEIGRFQQTSPEVEILLDAYKQFPDMFRKPFEVSKLLRELNKENFDTKLLCKNYSLHTLFANDDGIRAVFKITRFESKNNRPVKYLLRTYEDALKESFIALMHEHRDTIVSGLTEGLTISLFHESMKACSGYRPEMDALFESADVLNLVIEKFRAPGDRRIYVYGLPNMDPVIRFEDIKEKNTSSISKTYVDDDITER